MINQTVKISLNQVSSYNLLPNSTYLFIKISLFRGNSVDVIADTRGAWGVVEGSGWLALSPSGGGGGGRAAL